MALTRFSILGVIMRGMITAQSMATPDKATKMLKKRPNLAMEHYVSIAQSGYGYYDPVECRDRIGILILTLTKHQRHENRAI